MTMRVEFPAGEKRQRGGARVFVVDAKGNETPVPDVRTIEITSRPDDVVRIRVETWLHAPAIVEGEGTIVTLCPGCLKEFQSEDV